MPDIVDSILDRYLQAKGAGDDLLLNANRPQFNLPGADLRFIRGGFGDALLNSDQPNPNLVQQQFGQAQRAALPENAQLGSMLLAPFLQARMLAQAVPPQVGSFGKFLKDPITGKFLGSQSVKFLK